MLMPVLPAKKAAAYVLFIALLTAAGATTTHAAEITQTTGGPCGINSIVNGDNNVTTNTVNCVIGGILEVAQIQQITPKLVDFRTISDPGTSSLKEALEAEVVITVESLSYESLTQPAMKARILKQDATLYIDEKSFAFRWFQFANLGKVHDIGWLGRIGDAAPFTVDAGAVESKTTQFRPRVDLTWQQAVALLKTAKRMSVTITTTIAGVSIDPKFAASFNVECVGDLQKAQSEIAKFEALKKRHPMYVHIFCQGAQQ